jgi:hypothetical protein
VRKRKSYYYNYRSGDIFDVIVFAQPSIAVYGVREAHVVSNRLPPHHPLLEKVHILSYLLYASLAMYILAAIYIMVG